MTDFDAAAKDEKENGLPTGKRTGIVIDPRYAGHCMGPDEPECPERLDVLYALLEEPELSGCFQNISPCLIARDDLARVHSEDYINRLESTSGKQATYLDEDTSTSPLSNEAAQLAAGGLCRAIEEVHAGRVENAFALVRPPGHHAERAAAKGFCLYNNVAIAAHYAQSKLGLARILVVDWDLHHGNGTQHCFEDDPSVLFFSTHQAFTYPHSGRLREIGKGRGKGYTVNVPLLPGFGDGDYLVLFERLLKPIALEFKPDLILVSAGFDIHFNDPLGGMKMTPAGFAGLTRILLDIATQCCQGKLVMTLEGGYNLEALKDSVREVLREMNGRRTTDIRSFIASADPRKTAYVIWRVKHVHRKYWKTLAMSAAGEPVADHFPIMDRLKGDLARWMAFFRD
ncbi:histone deacetylase [uncultured Desulfosarcina sp.]|uniref:histone deacetylase family protein n=1 Tax=uncultured Desulfosarcina sp. TaxID=218289 RepID=UPI0029C7129A|nr:histone deacetylase [uncultured Desulfosarcina sp.]